MLKKRIIPCLDIKDGRVVKGIKFQNLSDLASPVDAAKLYYQQGADELVLLDITATIENRSILYKLIEKITEEIFIPITVGGGVRNEDDVRALLRCGADKVAINTAAVADPYLIRRLADIFGSQCIVIAIDVKRKNKSWEVFTNAGTSATGIDLFDWISACESFGAGEFLITSMDQDGTKQGYDLELYRKLSKMTNIPVIASGGVGKLDDIRKVLRYCEAALAASIFHYNEYTVCDIKHYLSSKNVEVRIC